MPVRIALVGIGGYGELYLNELVPQREEQDVQLVAGIDPQPERCSRLTELREAGVAVYPDLGQFYACDTADLVIISAPIQFHAPLTCLALANSSNVLCEKPLAGSLADAQQMVKAQQVSGKLVAIGYQWSFSNAVLALKRDILAGVFGRPLQLKTAVLWPRRRSYFQRSAWAGRIQADNGAWVLDSPVNNAAAHYLHNMLFLLGDEIGSSAKPISLQAELYRANEIENYDTAGLRLTTEDGADLLFLTSHAVEELKGPLIHFEFEEAVIEYPGDDFTFQAWFRGGKVKSYGSPDIDTANKLWHTVAAVRSGQPSVCGIRAALPHLICAVEAQAAPIHHFPGNLVRVQDEDSDPLTYADGLFGKLLDCYLAGILPSQNPTLPWARGSTAVDLRRANYQP